MPRNLSGVYSLPVIYEANPGETILSEQHNTPLEDIRDAFNDVAPIFAGGTDAATAVAAHDNLNTKGANIASAATTDLSLATGVLVTITGTAAITSFGTAVAGVERVLIFSAAATLTHNATSLILPGGANIVTAANDVAVMRSLGSGNWICAGYQRGANGLVGGASTLIPYIDAGATVGPVVVLFRDSASPAGSDLLGKVQYDFRDSGANQTEGANWLATLIDPTNGSEDARLTAQVIEAGTLHDILRLEGTTATVYSADAGATVGPVLNLFRDSASPANNDAIGKVLWQGRDGANNVQDMAAISVSVPDVANGSEDASMFIGVVNGGTILNWISALASGGVITATISVACTMGSSLDVAGNIQAGTFSATGVTQGATLSASAVSQTSTNVTSSVSQWRFYNPNGLVGSIATNASATAYNTSSDERLKQDFVDFDAGKILDALNVYEFHWKVDGSLGYGVKAQEAEAVFPAAVTPGTGEPGDEEFTPYSVDYSKFVPLLLREIHSLRARLSKAGL